MRQGLSVSVSMAIGMAIFVLAVATAFILLQGAVLPAGGSSEQVVATTTYALDRFEATTGWTLYQQPVIIRSDTALTDQPLELDTPFTPATVPSSIVYTRDGTERVSQHDTTRNTSVIVTDIRNGSTRLDAVYTTTHDLSDRTYTSTLTTAGNSTWNSRMNVTFTDTGFQQITYNGTAMLDAPADIAVATDPTIESSLLRTNVTYSGSDRLNLRVFDRSSQIRFDAAFSGQQVWTFNLTDNITTLYSSSTGSTQDITGSGTLFTDTTDFIDFYNQTGMAIIGAAMTVNVSRDGPSSAVDVRINVSDTNGEKAALFYLHDGNYTAAAPYEQNFRDPYTVSVGVPVPLSGISQEEAAAFDEKNDESVREALGIVSAAYNLTLDGIVTQGAPVTAETTVNAVSYPLPVMDRLANATARTLRMRVWNQ
jgi:hypothetical protein